MEGGGGAHRVLAGQAVGDQQGLGRAGDLRDLGRLGHHRFVDGGAAGGVEDDDVEALQLGRGHGPAGDVGRRLAGHDRQALDPGLLGQQGQLLHGGRAAGVERGQQDLLAVLGQLQGQLAGGGGLTRALQAGHHDDRRRVEREVQALGDIAAQHLDQAVIGDLHHLVGGADRADHLFAGGPFLGLGDELADDGQGDVGLEQGDTHLAQGFVDVLFREHAPPGEAVEDPGKPICQCVEHAVELL